MRRPVLANLEDLDPRTRNAAEAAARRAGLPFEDWVDAILAERLAPRTVHQRQEDRRSPAPDDLDAIIARLANGSRRNDSRHFIAEDNDNHRRKAAIESLARWIETAEERISATARHSTDQEDRLASVMSEALHALKTRVEAVERRAAPDSPVRIEFPIDDALRALSPLAETLVGLKTDVSRLADRLDEQPTAPTGLAVDTIAAQIDEMKAALRALATREEIEALGGNLKSLSRDLEKRPSGTAVMTLSGAIATLHGQVADLSDELRQGLHGSLGSAIEGLERKVDRLAQSGIDRSVIDFLSSQIVDLRHDLGNRAEPRQIERLSLEVGALSRELADLRSEQVVRGDFESLKSALERVCGLVARSVASQHAQDVPEQIRGLGEKLDALAQRPVPHPSDLDTVAAQLTVLTDRMSAVADQRFDENDGIQAQLDRLSAQIGTAIEASSKAHTPLWERFDRLEAELRQLGDRPAAAPSEALLQAIDEKLQTAFGPAIKSALKSLPSGGDDASSNAADLKHGFAELKSLQAKTESRTQETLRAIHEALETLVSRFPDRDVAGSTRILSRTQNQPADRLEAAVRRLHAAAISQIEEVSATPPVDTEHHAGASTSREGADIGNLRAGFIAAARRASQGGTAIPHDTEGDGSRPENQGEASSDNVLSTSSLIERIRKTFDGNRKPLLFSVAFLALLTNSAEMVWRTSSSAPFAAVTGDPDPTTKKLPADGFSLSNASDGTTIQASFRTEKAADDSDPADRANVARLLEQDAEAGVVPAQRDIAEIYEKGLGVERDLRRAYVWYERASHAGNLQAMHSLATLLASRIGGKPDYSGAFRWYSEAAEGGLRDSQFNLGVLLTRGIGMPRNLPRAYQWFDVAAKQGDGDAAEKRDEIARQMAPPELATAKLLAERWRARPFDHSANGVARPIGGRTAALDPSAGGKI